ADLQNDIDLTLYRMNRDQLFEKRLITSCLRPLPKGKVPAVPAKRNAPPHCRTRRSEARSDSSLSQTFENSENLAGPWSAASPVNYRPLLVRGSQPSPRNGRWLLPQHLR